MNRIIRLFCVFLLSFSSFAVAQSLGTGLYNFGSFDSMGLDTINLGNLNAHITIPIFHKAGRGIPFGYDLTYDSLVWYPAGMAGSQTWVPVQNFGWLAQTVVMTGYLSYATHTYVCDWPPPKHGNFKIYDTWVYHDAFGVSHPFSGQLEYDPTGCDTTTTSFTSQSLDGSGFTLTATGSGTPHTTQNITTRNRQTMVVPTGPASAGSSITDSNGNQVSVSAGGVYTDTLGTPALTVGGAGSAASPLTLTYPVTLQTDSAATASATVFYRTYTVQTNFQCPGIGESGANSVDLVDHITLADAVSTYNFTYEPTPGVAGAVTGRLASVTLPTGGTTTYSYSGGCNNSGINQDGTGATLTRTTSDGPPRTYTANASATSTFVQDEKGNQTLYNFSIYNGLFYETQREVYQGAIGGPNLLSVFTCYNGAQPPCDGAAVNPPFSQTIAVTSYNNGVQDSVQNSYDSYGMLTGSIKGQWGASTLQSQGFVYNGSEQMTQATTYDGSGNIAAQTNYGYDGTAPTTTSGIPQHSVITGTPGNQTSSSTIVGGGVPNITTSTAYYDTGVPVSTTTPNGTTQYSYESTQTFATTTTLPTPSSGVSLATSASYDQQSGAQISATGMNTGQTTQVTQYDRLLRPRSVSYPDSGQTTYYYTDVNTFWTDRALNSSTTSHYVTHTDGYGRLDRTALFNGQSGNPWYQVDYCFDATGLLQFQSTAYQGTGFGGANAAKQCSGSGTSYLYDALGRVTSITTADGTATTQYNGRAVKTTDVNGVQKITKYDLLGRISAVCEVSSSTLQGDSHVDCGMDIAGTGFRTVYSYDLLNHKTTITQGAQTRTFTTDYAGRTIDTTEPERGETKYSYAYNGTGLVVTRQRPKANQTSPGTLTTTTTQYDSLGRVVGVGYDDNLTPSKTFVYDTGCCWPNTSSATNLKGRLAVVGASINNNGTNQTGGLFSYDIMGNVHQMWQCAPETCFDSNATVVRQLSFWYDLAGNLTGEQDWVSGMISYGRSPAGEVTSITNQTYTDPTNTPNLVSNVVNAPNGPITYDLGNGVSALRTYDSSGRLNGGWLCPTSGNSNCYNAQIYGFYAPKKGQQVQGACDTVAGGCKGYGYDEFNRLTSLSGPPSFSYVYDRYGNRTAQNAPQGGPAPSYSVNPANNQIINFSYDAAGNLTIDGIHTYTYDAEGKVLKVDNGATASYLYDALDHRVRVQTPSSTNEYIYDYAGRRISTWLPNNAGIAGRIYWDNQQLAYRSYEGSTFFDHQDFMGTERLRTDYTGAISSTYTSLPWGDGYTPNENDPSGNAQDNAHYALLEHDNESGTEHAQFRQYSSTQGRWMSPDPYDGSYDGSDPQSLNRYSYVLNNPPSLFDPLGLDVGDYLPPVNGVPTIQGPGLKGCGASCSNLNFGVGSGDMDGGIPLVYLGAFHSRGGGSAPNNCLKPNAAQRLAIKALSYLASYTGHTVGYGVGGSASAGGIGPFGFNFGASQQLLVSPDGTAGLATTYTKQLFSVASKGAGAIAGLQLTASSIQTFGDSSGLSLNVGASLADGVGVGIDHSFSGGNYTSTLTLGAGFGGQGHAGTFTYTTATPFCPIT